MASFHGDAQTSGHDPYGGLFKSMKMVPTGSVLTGLMMSNFSLSRKSI